MKRILVLWFLLLALTNVSFGQEQDTVPQQHPATEHENHRTDSSIHRDTTESINGLAPDTTYVENDSLSEPIIITEGLNPNVNTINRGLKENPFLNTTAVSPKMPVVPRKDNHTTDLYFYIACTLLLLLGIFRASNRGYIFSLFSVYFNTSLKQNQLTDRLIQARIPSFILNVFFVIVTGTFAWLIIRKSNVELPFSTNDILYLSLAAVLLIYISKYCFFKFFGWLSGFSTTISRYLFIVFLINKIIGIILIPFVILLLFGKPEWADTLVTIGLLSAGFLLLSRYIRGYVLLKRGFVLTPFHFILFIAAVEVIPLLLIYKAISNYLMT